MATNELDELHAGLVAAMLRELKFAAENDVPVPAADKAAIAKFLKDNNVTKAPQDDDELAALRKRMQERNADQRAKATSAVDLAREDVTVLYGEH